MEEEEFSPPSSLIEVFEKAEKTLESTQKSIQCIDDSDIIKIEETITTDDDVYNDVHIEDSTDLALQKEVLSQLESKKKEPEPVQEPLTPSQSSVMNLVSQVVPETPSMVLGTRDAIAVDSFTASEPRFIGTIDPARSSAFESVKKEAPKDPPVLRDDPPAPPIPLPPPPPPPVALPEEQEPTKTRKIPSTPSSDATAMEQVVELTRKAIPQGLSNLSVRLWGGGTLKEWEALSHNVQALSKKKAPFPSVLTTWSRQSAMVLVYFGDSLEDYLKRDEQLRNSVKSHRPQLLRRGLLIVVGGYLLSTPNNNNVKLHRLQVLRYGRVIKTIVKVKSNANKADTTKEPTKPQPRVADRLYRSTSSFTAKGLARVRERRQNRREKEQASSRPPPPPPPPPPPSVNSRLLQGTAASKSRVYYPKPKVGPAPPTAAVAKTPTVPKAPNFATDRKLGLPPPRLSQAGTSLAQSSQVFGKGLRSIPVTTGRQQRRPRLTVPVAPKLTTSKRLGEAQVEAAKPPKPATPSPRNVRRTVTVPKEPRFMTRDRHGDKSSAAQTAAYASATPTRVFSQGLRKSMPVAARRRRLSVTVPVAPRFHETTQRQLPKSSEEREMDIVREAEKQHIKAKTIATRHPTRKVRQSLPLASEMTKEEEDEREMAKQFKAAPMPVYRKTPVRISAKVRVHTDPQPFKLSSGSATAKPKAAQTSATEDLLEMRRQFKARPSPKTTWQAPKPGPRHVDVGQSPPTSFQDGIAKAAASQASRRRTSLPTQERLEAARQRRQALLEVEQRSPRPTDTPSAKPFSLHSVARHEAFQQKLADKAEADEHARRSAATFRARSFVPSPPDIVPRSTTRKSLSPEATPSFRARALPRTHYQPELVVTPNSRSQLESTGSEGRGTDKERVSTGSRQSRQEEDEGSFTPVHREVPNGHLPTTSPDHAARSLGTGIDNY